MERNLKINTSGEDVKALQTYLKGIGMYTGKVDGIFGPITQTAVKQFQASNGLTADGIVGPKTRSALSSVQAGSKPQGNTLTTNTTNNTYNTGNPAQDDLLNQLSKYVQDQVASGLTINPNLNIDQSTLDQFLETAKRQVNPYYQQQIDSIRQDVTREAPQILGQYENEVAGREANFRQNLDTSRENAAGSGTVFSGRRAAQELSAKETEDRNLSSLASNYSNKFYDLGRGAEQKIGAGNVNYSLPSLNKYSSTTEGAGGFNQGGSVQGYQPGSFQLGEIPLARDAAAEARNQALRETAANNIRIGRSYQDLLRG